MSLISLYDNIFNVNDNDDELIAKPDLTKFLIDKRHRKAYVSNNIGEVFVINC